VSKYSINTANKIGIGQSDHSQPKPIDRHQDEFHKQLHKVIAANIST
jgi:hypothetical protein